MATASETVSPPAAATPAAGGTTPAASATSPSGTPAGLPGTGQPSGWWDSVKDPETKTWLASKNYPDADHALMSSLSMEKLFGADKAGRAVMLPKDDNDAEGWKALSAKLGVPANAADYKLPVPEGDDGKFSGLVSGWMQEAGIPPRAGRILADKWNALATENMKAEQKVETERKAASTLATEQLRAEWGPKADENTELARRGFRDFAKQFGIDADPTKAEDALGSANFLKFFLGLGTMNGESTFAGNGADPSKTNIAASREAAQTQINAWTKARAAGEISNLQWEREIMPQYDRLLKIVAG